MAAGLQISTTGMNLSNIYYLYEIGGKKTQEDYIWPQPGAATDNDTIFIVCDGVGGSENGEVASRIIAEFAGKTLMNIPAASLSTEMINELLVKAQQKLVEYAREHLLNSDMATTFSLLVLNSQGAFIAWCGDSRVYHIRNGIVLYKTADHSLVNTLVKKGELTEEEASSHPQKNIILKAIRADYSVIEAEAGWITDIQDGDYFMLCTDGVLENISDNNLSALLHGHNGKPVDITEKFQQLCYNKTRDNYSMYLLQIGKSNYTPQVKHKKRWVFYLLLTLCSIATVIAGYYYFSEQRKEQKKLFDSVIPYTTDTSLVALTDTTQKNTLPAFEKIPQEKIKDSSKKKLPAFTITKPTSGRIDSLAVKPHISKKKADSIPFQKTITEKQTDSLEKPLSN